MKLKAFAVALALAGVGTSVAIANGAPRGAPAGASDATIRVCHRTGSATAAFRSASVARSSLEEHMRHGDRLPRAGGDCARPGRFAAA